MLSRTLNIAWKDMLHLWHNRLLLIMAIFGAACELLLIGWATGSKIDNLKVVVVDYDGTPTSQALIDRLATDHTLHLDRKASQTVTADFQLHEDRNTVLDDLFTGGNFIFNPDPVLLIEIPAGFEAGLQAGLQPEINLTVNGANSLPGTTARRAVESDVYTFGLVVMAQADTGGGSLVSAVNDPALEQLVAQRIEASQPPVTVRYNEKLNRAHYTTPSEAAFILYIIAIMIAAFMLAREREMGTFEQLLVMPMRPIEIIFGKAIPAMAIGYANFMLVLGIMNQAFGISVRGSLPLLMILALGYLFVEIGRGFFVALISRTQNQALLIIMLIAFIDITFSGYAVPVESMPPAMQAASNLFPIRHWMIILRGILQKGVGLDILWPQIVWLVVLGVIINTGTLWLFRRTLSDQH